MKWNFIRANRWRLQHWLTHDIVNISQTYRLHNYDIVSTMIVYKSIVYLYFINFIGILSIMLSLKRHVVAVDFISVPLNICATNTQRQPVISAVYTLCIMSHVMALF